jgi:uncharacterized protein (UPF0333 family)
MTLSYSCIGISILVILLVWGILMSYLVIRVLKKNKRKISAINRCMEEWEAISDPSIKSDPSVIRALKHKMDLIGIS